MFEALLEEVFKKAGDLYAKITADEHQELIKEFLPWLSLESEALLGASRAVLGTNIFEESEIGLEYSHLKPDEKGLMSLPIDIGCMYIRRNRGDRTISINNSIYRRNVARHRHEPASINVEFYICGDKEKKAFEELYKNYRRPIEKLLEDNQVEFFTSYCSDIIGKYKGRSPSKKLDEYLSDPNGDNCFSLSKNFIKVADSTEIIRVFLLFSALYHSCHGYLAKPKNIDRFAAHIPRLQ